MSFLPANPGTGTDHSEIIQVIAAGSAVIAVGELTKLDATTGFATNSSTQTKILGVVVGFVTSAGVPLQPTAYSAGTATGTDVQSYTFASTNQTVEKYRVIVEMSKAKKWSAQVNGTIGTTVHSDQPGAFIDVDSANSHYDRVLETTATRTAGSADHLAVWGTDPNDSTRMIVSIANSVRDNN